MVTFNSMSLMLLSLLNLHAMISKAIPTCCTRALSFLSTTYYYLIVQLYYEPLLPPTFLSHTIYSIFLLFVWQFSMNLHLCCLLPFCTTRFFPFFFYLGGSSMCPNPGIQLFCNNLPYLLFLLISYRAA